MSLRLLKYGFNEDYAEPRYFNTPDELASSYDVVIIGAGGHGLGCAYYLAKEHGITNVAVLVQSYIGGGNTGRNTVKQIINQIIKQYHHYPLKLSNPGRRQVLRCEPCIVQGFLRRIRFQYFLFRARAFYFGP